MTKAAQAIGLSFDIECYYQIVRKDYLGEYVKPTEEVLHNTMWILDQLRNEGAKATFYFLGNVAEHYPELVMTAVKDGHEIGVHGDQHEYINKLDPGSFRKEIASALEKIRAAGADQVVGHRAPAFSIGSANLWALDVLKEFGLQHDSSIMPFAGKRYGIANYSKIPVTLENGMAEIPLSVVTIAGKTLPCMGGGYVRYFPLAYTRFCAKQLHSNGLTPVCYFHPYEFEHRPAQITPEMAIGTPQQMKGLKRMNFMQSIGRGAPMRKKLLHLIRNYRSATIGSLHTRQMPN